MERLSRAPASFLRVLSLQYLTLPCLLLFLATLPLRVVSAPQASGTEQKIYLLGPHEVGGRGCTACHPAHQPSAAANVGLRNGIWEQNTTLTFNATGRFGNEGASQARTADFTTAETEVGGVLLCISCHDGNLTPQNMLANDPYEHRLASRDALGHQRRYSFLDDTAFRDPFAFDHPVGPASKIDTGDGLEFINGAFVVIPGTPYAQFVRNYGLPTLAQARVSTYGVDQQGRPYLLCTTCHNPHANNLYTSSPASPIAKDAEGHYTTFFFLNAPYNPSFQPYSVMPGVNSPSNVQFCRQCHFRFSNEANNTNNIPTLF